MRRGFRQKWIGRGGLDEPRFREKMLTARSGFTDIHGLAQQTSEGLATRYHDWHRWRDLLGGTESCVEF
jgi:hypothetical protein